MKKSTKSTRATNSLLKALLSTFVLGIGTSVLIYAAMVWSLFYLFITILIFANLAALTIVFIRKAIQTVFEISQVEKEAIEFATDIINKSAIISNEIH